MTQLPMQSPTPEQVEASVEANMKKLEPRFAEFSGLMKLAADLIETDEIPANRLIRLKQIAAGVADIAGSVAACRAGCAHCCHMAVAVSSSEAQAIADHIGVAPLSPTMNFDQEASVGKYMNVPCPFLKKKHCTIYDVRPSACRTHYNVSNYPQQCDTVNNPGQEVPTLDMRPLWAAQTMAYLENGEVIADLREFFPNGADVPQSL